MKTLSIQSYNFTTKKQLQKNNSDSLVGKSSQKQFMPNFGIATGRTGGGSAYLNYPPAWSARLMKILDRSASEMQDLAEYFHNKTNTELVAVAQKAHWISEENADRAAKRLIDYVTPIREKKAKMEDRAAYLEKQDYLNDSNKKELNTLKDEIKRLNSKARMARDKFEKMISW